jgi:hypothetical protein
MRHVGAVGVHELLYSMGDGKQRASTQDMNVARIHAGIFGIMGSMLFNPRKRINSRFQ